jgi:protein transport protein SEC61 subunit gamma-like protein
MKTPTDLSSYVRVLKLASTPAWDEFSQVAKIAGVGILLVGFIGFMIFAFMSFVPGGP